MVVWRIYSGLWRTVEVTTIAYGISGNNKMETGLDADRIVVLARTLFRRDCCQAIEWESVQCDLCRGDVRISLSANSPNSIDVVQLNFRIRKQYDVVWVEDLRVTTEFQGQGRGRQLVQTVESIARSLGVHNVRLLPLWSARPFWGKMGYHDLASSARVMTKDVFGESKPQPVFVDNRR